MKRFVKIGLISFIFLISTLLVYAVTTETAYNPFTGKLDYITSLNQSGNNITADYFFGNGSSITDITASDIWVNESGDTMTGNLDMGANNLTVDSNLLFADSEGNRVGILTTSMGSSLEIGTNVEVSEPRLELIGFDNTVPLFRIGSGGATSWTLGRDASNNFYTVMSGTWGVTGGNVGIGTASPTQTLTVAGNLNATGNITSTNGIFDYVNISTDAGGILKVGNSSGQVLIVNNSRITLRQPGGTPGTDELWIYHNGVSTVFEDRSNGWKFRTGGAEVYTLSASAFVPSASTRDLGTTASEWGELYVGDDASSGVLFGLDQDFRFYYNETSADRLQLKDAGGNVIMSFATGDNVIVGDAGTDSHSLTSSDDLFVSGKLEVDGNSFFDADSTYADDTDILLGAGSDSAIQWETAQTNDALFMGLGASNTLILGEKGDMGYNFAYASQTNPTVFIPSATQSTTEWGSLSHDTNKFQLDSGTNVTEIVSETHLNDDVYAGADLIVGDEVSDYDLFTIESNGTDVNILSYQGLNIRFGNSTHTWGTFLSNGTLVLDYGCVGC